MEIESHRRVRWEGVCAHFVAAADLDLLAVRVVPRVLALGLEGDLRAGLRGDFFEGDGGEDGEKVDSGVLDLLDLLGEDAGVCVSAEGGGKAEGWERVETMIADCAARADLEGCGN